MLERIALFSVARRKSVMAATCVLVILAAVFGSQVFSNLTSEGFLPANSESERADRILDEQFNVDSPNVLLLVDGKGKPVTDPAVVKAGTDAAAELATLPGVKNVVSYWAAPQADALRSNDGTKALITAELDDADDNIERVVTDMPSDTADALVLVGGSEAIGHSIGTQVSKDLARAESIAFPLVMVLLVVVFGAVVAAAVPLIVGVLAIVGTFLVLYLFTTFTDVSVFSINLVTMMGLGLGIDYSLFVVSRYKEELNKGLDRDAAIVRAVATAGRTVVFSAVAIAVSLSALLVFPLFFLRSFAYAGVSVVVIAALASVVFLPALLAALGPCIDKWKLVKSKPLGDGSEFWAKVAKVVMRRPAIVAIVTTVALLLLAAPFLNVKWGAIDDRVLPEDAPAHVVGQTLRTDFARDESSTLTVVAPGAAADPVALAAYATAVSRIENITRVDTSYVSFADGVPGPAPATGATLASGNAAAVRIVLGVESASTAAVNAAQDVRAVDAPFETLVTGFAATQVDSNEPIKDGLPLAALLLVAGSFVILFLMTGSVVLPLKAVLMAALSLTASLGAVVWIFQYGHLAEVLQFTPTGSIDHTNVIVMFCIAFGLSMDYEVFLLSRIKEEHDISGDTRDAIAKGLERTGRLVTAAALLISVVFLAFATSGIAFIKLIGIGLAIAIIVDATIVRGLMVPALMRLMGEANWWAPKPLRKVYERFGISESGSK